MGYFLPSKVPILCPNCGKRGDGKWVNGESIFEFHKTFADEAECKERGVRLRVEVGLREQKDAEAKERGRKYFMGKLRRENDELQREVARLRSADEWVEACQRQETRQAEVNQQRADDRFSALAANRPAKERREARLAILAKYPLKGI